MNEYRAYSLLYNRIKDEIANQGLTVSKAYKKAGLKKPGTFDQILEGKGRMDTIVKLCEALDLNIKIEPRMYL